jgi:hypothetical protein
MKMRGLELPYLSKDVYQANLKVRLVAGKMSSLQNDLAKHLRSKTDFLMFVGMS